MDTSKARADRFAADRRQRKFDRHRHAEKTQAKRDKLLDVLSKY